MITLNHLLVPSRDKDTSARDFAELLGLEVTDKSPGSTSGTFAVVIVDGVHFDFATIDTFKSHHYAFHVDDETFNSILSRVKENGSEFAADPAYKRVGELNDNQGGRGFYVRSIDGHNIEFLTRL